MTTRTKELKTTYNQVNPGEAGNTKIYPICGATLRQPEESRYEICHRPAGWGTHHAGKGRCKLHGGAKRERTYSNLWKGRMAEVARVTLERDDTNPLDLLAELEVQRVMLAVMIDRLNGGTGDIDPDNFDRPAERAVVDEMNRRARFVYRRARNTLVNDDTGGVGGGALIGDDTDTVVGGRAELPLTEPESNVTLPLNNELVEQIRGQLNDIVTTVTRIVAQRNQTAMTKAEVTWFIMTMKEGMDKFVPKENQEAYVRWMMAHIPGVSKESEEGGYVEGEALE